MKIIKQSIPYLFLGIEFVIFLGVYFFGSHGYKSWLKLKKDNSIIIQDLKNLEKEIFYLKKKIDISFSDDFYKEKVAREQLQMSKKNDTIYFYD